MGFPDFFERQDRALAAAKDRRLGAIQAHYADPWYGDEEQEDEEEDGEYGKYGEDYEE